MILFFDLETDGLPRNWKAPMIQLDNWPRIIQIGWIVTELNGTEINRGKYLIKPDGWRVPNLPFWIDNGFSQQESLDSGIPIGDALDLFITDLNNCQYLVSHNMDFDYNICGSEMIRASKRAKKVTRICTKEASTDYCKLPGNYGYKWPKLIELYTFLFNKGFEGAHDALADVIACKDCFFELVRLGVIKNFYKQPF